MFADYHIYEGAETQTDVSNVNKALGTNITVEDILFNPNYCYETFQEKFEENPHNDNAYINALDTKEKLMKRKRIIKIVILAICLITPEMLFYFDWWKRNLDMTKWPDYSKDCTIVATETTEKMVVILNYRLFKGLNQRDNRARSIAVEYGIDSNNPLTVEWIMENPDKAADIVSYLFIFIVENYDDCDYVESLYNFIISGERDKELGISDASEYLEIRDEDVINM